MNHLKVESNISGLKMDLQYSFTAEKCREIFLIFPGVDKVNHKHYSSMFFWFIWFIFTIGYRLFIYGKCFSVWVCGGVPISLNNSIHQINVMLHLMIYRLMRSREGLEIVNICVLLHWMLYVKKTHSWRRVLTRHQKLRVYNDTFGANFSRGSSKLYFHNFRVKMSL